VPSRPTPIRSTQSCPEGITSLSAVAFGWLFFADLPNAMTFAGMAVITASGLYIFHRERVVERENRA
jgi:drug/metabolite transporter (DMT)-like permease